ncbi:MAG: uracil-DNA glycosylase [Chloroflexi bacterium]|nr:uracil-DNA glycosylase [Chloroflexota bacterium]
MSEFDDLVRNITTCELCILSKSRTRAVPGEGSMTPSVMFIGEGPGYHEDQQGRPFVGAAGQFLSQLLASIGMSRGDIYITNMVKCRAPNNRDPLPGEIEACRLYLDKQIELLKPKIIVTLGRHSLARFFPRETISKARGKPRRWNGIIIYPMYHPAAALHQQSLRHVIEEDIKLLPRLLQEAENPPPKEEPGPHQLNMF